MTTSSHHVTRHHRSSLGLVFKHDQAASPALTKFIFVNHRTTARNHPSTINIAVAGVGLPSRPMAHWAFPWPFHVVFLTFKQETIKEQF
jgi:hypothetical protein